ncbi:hypothetical protein GCM10010339_52790 [Streptomyces alanosinicus]|uniref:Uncharacterized protein n=1 Tax=Streptomyces alanosinicus TaxID=68171 RepID=A0A919D4D6_9ACTN|nr:hypothetical protein GCM10010339_52790 [Streptomyces alanosinicus]
MPCRVTASPRWFMTAWAPPVLVMPVSGRCGRAAGAADRDGEGAAVAGGHMAGPVAGGVTAGCGGRSGVRTAR